MCRRRCCGWSRDGAATCHDGVPTDVPRFQRRAKIPTGTTVPSFCFTGGPVVGTPSSHYVTDLTLSSGGWEAKRESKGSCVPLSRPARRLDARRGSRSRTVRFLGSRRGIHGGGNIPVVDSRLPRGGYPQLRWRRRRAPLLGRLGVGSRGGGGVRSGSSPAAAARVSLAPPTVGLRGVGSHGRYARGLRGFVVLHSASSTVLCAARD